MFGFLDVFSDCSIFRCLEFLGIYVRMDRILFLNGSVMPCADCWIELNHNILNCRESTIRREMGDF